jgi:hypothetical protein
MPVITIESKARWSDGNALVTDIEKSMVLEIGECLPWWLVEAMGGEWDASDVQQIGVKFSTADQRNINTPDIWITIEIGQKWEEYVDDAIKPLKKWINHWIADHVKQGVQRPSFDLEFILVNWRGASFDRKGVETNTW